MVTNKIGRTPLFTNFISFILLDKYLDVKIINPNLMNSLGCIPKLPIPNQLLLPFLMVPIPGIRTSIQRKKQTIRMMFALFKE